MSAGQEVERYPDADALAAAVAARTYEVLGAALADRGEAHLVVTGGGILERTFAAMADPPAGFDWSAVHVWWADERFEPAGSDERNDQPAMTTLFDRVPVDAAKLHRMPASDAGFDSVEAAAQSYAAELASAAGESDLPALDVALIGVGPDGHCCSLFPGHPGTRVLDRSVTAVHDSPKPPPDRLSFTFPTLDAIRELWFVAAGEGKADAVAKALSGDYRAEQVPSSAPRGTEHTRWLIDEAAAARL